MRVGTRPSLGERGDRDRGEVGHGALTSRARGLQALGRAPLRRQRALLGRPDLGAGVEQVPNAVGVAYAELIQRPRHHGRLAQGLHHPGVVGTAVLAQVRREPIARRDEVFGRLAEQRHGIVGERPFGHGVMMKDLTASRIHQIEPVDRDPSSARGSRRAREHLEAERVRRRR